MGLDSNSLKKFRKEVLEKLLPFTEISSPQKERLADYLVFGDDESVPTELLKAFQDPNRQQFFKQHHSVEFVNRNASWCRKS